MEASEILIANIKEEIPSIILSKFEELGITDLASILSIDLTEFSQRRGIGQTVSEKLKRHQQKINDEIEKFEELQIKNTVIRVSF